MTENDEDAFFQELEKALMNDDGAAAREHLAAGFPIYVQTDDTPPGVIEKRLPDGTVTFVIFDVNGERPAEMR